MREVLYRYEYYRVSTGMTEWGESCGSRCVVYLREFPIIRRTPKGAWIEYAFGKKFVLLTGRKKFAHETKKAAIQSLIKRKERHIRILESQLQDIKETLHIAERLENEQ